MASRVEGTGDWFLRTKEYNDWKSGETKTFWCRGIRTFVINLVAVLSEYKQLEVVKAQLRMYQRRPQPLLIQVAGRMLRGQLRMRQLPISHWQSFSSAERMTKQ